jgi:hypothetical protein
MVQRDRKYVHLNTKREKESGRQYRNKVIIMKQGFTFSTLMSTTTTKDDDDGDEKKSILRQRFGNHK